MVRYINMAEQKPLFSRLKHPVPAMRTASVKYYNKQAAL